MIVIVIIISALLGLGGGFGAFYYTKSLQSAQQSLTQKTTNEETGDLTREKNAESKSQDESFISIKHFYDNEELTKEGAITFLKLRAEMQGLPPEKVSKMIEDLDRMSKKIAVIEAFKILAMQYSLMEFAEFKEPKLKGL